MSVDGHQRDPILVCRYERTRERGVLRLEGELDGLGCEEVHPILDDLLERPGTLDLDVDLRDVSFIDAQGVNLLVRTELALAPKGGHLRFVGLSPTVSWVLHVAGVSDRFAPEVQGS